MWDKSTLGTSANPSWLETLWHRQIAPQRTPSWRQSRPRSTSHHASALTLRHDNNSVLFHVQTDYQGTIETPRLTYHVTALHSSSPPGFYSPYNSTHVSLTLTLPQHPPPPHRYQCHHHRRRLRRPHDRDRMPPSRTQSLRLRVLPKAPTSWRHHFLWTQRRTYRAYSLLAPELLPT